MRKLGTRDFMDSGLVRDALASREELAEAKNERDLLRLVAKNVHQTNRRYRDRRLFVGKHVHRIRDFNDSRFSLATIFRASRT